LPFPAFILIFLRHYFVLLYTHFIKVTFCCVFLILVLQPCEKVVAPSPLNHSPDFSLQSKVNFFPHRLGLERCTSAKEALDAMTWLFAAHGFGGMTEESANSAKTAHNFSFIICDNSEAWILETVGEHWAAERVTSTCCAVVDIFTMRLSFLFYLFLFL
jgi:hypothetical protein